MAKIGKFLKSGELGPVILGATPTDITEECGKPDETSRKMNPLILLYGEVQLTFLRTPIANGPRLHEIQVSMRPDPDRPSRANSPTSPIFLEDAAHWRASTKSKFMTLARDSGCSPLGEGYNQVQFTSGVTASFENGILDKLRLSKKEATERPPQKIVDEREPSLEQIRAMIDESQRAYSVGASRGAILILWAALEALLRRAAASRGNISRSSVAPHVLISELYASGFLSPSQMRLLEEARQVRMAAAHGLAPTASRPMLLQELAEVTKTFLMHPAIYDDRV